MSDAIPRAPHGRTSGFLHTCRLSPDGTFGFDAPLDEIERLLELTPVEVRQMLAANQFPVLPDAGPEFMASLRESAERLLPWGRDMRVVTPRTKREVWVRVHGVPRREADGAVEWTGIVTEITDLKSAEDRLRVTVQQLARSDARIRAALDGARMICWDLDLETDQWETTLDLADFYGLPLGADYSNPTAALAAVHPDDVPNVLAGRERAIRTGEPMRYEFRGRAPAPDGTPRWYSTRGRVLHDAGGKAIRIVAVTTDVTVRKNAEAERESLNRQLLDAQKWESLGVLAGGVAHDFNNILTVVLGSAGLARKSLLPASPAGPHLDQIEQASRRAADLCRQLLAYAGRGQIAAGKTDLNQLIRNSAALFGVSPSESVTIRYELAEGLPRITADAAPVRQVLVNLVLNAAESFGERGGTVVVGTQIVEIPAGGPPDYHLSASPGRYVRLSVSDSGPGIAAEVRMRMFDPFFTTKFAGRGLGLAAVLGIMRAHHGAIRVVSEPGKGTSVEALWPVVVAPAAAPAHPVKATANKALVVDDEMYVREVTAATVQELGFEPLVAGEATAALALYLKHRAEVRVAVIDVVMPGMGGDQLMRDLRALDPGLPVVLVSGFADRRAVGLTTGPNTEFLQKPFHPEELIVAVRRVIGTG